MLHSAIQLFKDKNIVLRDLESVLLTLQNYLASTHIHILDPLICITSELNIKI
jgi:hypothetical protein